ncbi:hypothetical protein PTSG_12408 [Salpingoeca rosetta]|uniref:Uncharacterized protein n=1 Tax=Salpingoeca rosetta (strain ATCC 50818 / BSB-021) TaxID=946362 RepID=F2UC57_SALR5|nr:uncharacterized protein PTSG_12408 [Salpingoeca rosetta]EGD74164.1 hypothetical protein PTSG_12408 [Salpingoeca rosetta]|eukprot:XP_004993064.1 hypothetical protein PTSG_12408 [Salpingoeca rosetta]
MRARLLRELSVQQRKKEIEEELLVLQAMEEKIRDTLDGLELEEVALRAMISTPEEDEDMTDYSSDT